MTESDLNGDGRCADATGEYERKVPPIMEQRWWTALVLFPAWVVQEIRKARRG